MIKHYIAKRMAVLLVLIGLCGAAGYGQPQAKSTAVSKSGTKRLKTITHQSTQLTRQMSYRVFLPVGYQQSKKKRFATLYLLHGLTGNYKNWSDNTRLEDYLRGTDLIIVMPDGRNGWYTDSATVKQDNFESYLIKELIPTIDREYRTKANRENRLIAGLSMGGYGALKFGLKYPEKFILAGSFSGALRAAEWNGKDFATWKALADSIDATYGSPGSRTRKENNIFKILEEKSREDLEKLPFFYLDCGTEDILIKQNREFSELLFNQKVPHEFRMLPGKHDWPYWNSQVAEFLEIAAEFISRSQAKEAVSSVQ